MIEHLVADLRNKLAAINLNAECARNAYDREELKAALEDIDASVFEADALLGHVLKHCNPGTGVQSESSG